MREGERQTIGERLAAEAARRPDAPLFRAPPDAGRPWHPEGAEFTRAEAAAEIARLAEALRRAGVGHGHRIALDLENRPEHFWWKLAMNALGASCVPVNPDLRPAEVAYLLTDSAPVLAVVAPNRAAPFRAAMTAAGREDLPVHVLGAADPLPPLPAPPLSGGPTGESEACLIYTSGTTGRPKGCIISHAYEIAMGEWYAGLGGLLTLGEGERLYNPLPLFHINSGVVSFMAMLLSGGCQIQPARFSASAWWGDIREGRASMAHYLGVVIPVLMAAPPRADDRDHPLRVLVGAGVEPTLHVPCEERFGVPLVEVWGMTEMCRVLADNFEPRMRETRAIGRPREGLEARVVDETGREAPRGTPGEMVLRHSAATPRKGFFSGYLNRPEETEEAWRGGWFHTGDTVTMDESGMIFFVDRRKNIIRRSGENIAAAEVEAAIVDHPAAAQAAVLAAPDAMRDEEVYACVVPAPGAPADAATARAIFDHVFARLAYYKAPGWLLFVDELPVTGTQKVVKHRIFAEGEDMLARPGLHDFRALKKR